jgi:glycosyltransferase involved in cell wall biosynthesis
MRGWRQARPALRVYTPHGGSLHYRWGSPTGFLYLALERVLMRRTDLFLFEKRLWAATPSAPRSAIPAAGRAWCTTASPKPSSLRSQADAQATDLVFIGELRALKGVDVLITAIVLLAQDGRPVTATIVGEGPDRAAFEAQATAAGFADAIRFVGAKPARTGFALGRLLVFLHGRNRCPTSCWRRPPPECRSSPPGSAEFPKFSASTRTTWWPRRPRGAGARHRRSVAGSAAMHDATARLQSRVHAGFPADVMTSAVLGAYAHALENRHG